MLLVTRPPGYVLAVDPDELDLTRFERLVAQARRVDPGASADAPRRRLPCGAARRSPTSRSSTSRRRRCAGSRSCGSAALEDRPTPSSRPAATPTRPELEALVAEHPLRERLRTQLMLALYRGGRQAEALEVYQDARRALADGARHRPEPGAPGALRRGSCGRRRA